MQRPVLAAAAALSLLWGGAVPAAAGPIETACLRSDRGAGRAVCGCIQAVADMTLKGGDQRRAAKFFADPDAAQKVRMSDRDSDNAFWERYRNFGATAEVYCAG